MSRISGWRCDVLGGQVPAAINGLSTTLQSIKAGKVRALATTSAGRSRLLPELPTIAEAGLPAYAVSTRTGLCAPAGTPRAVAGWLDDDIRMALTAPETRGCVRGCIAAARGRGPRRQNRRQRRHRRAAYRRLTTPAL
ncbi:MAG: hypothetical protein H7Z19_07395, partial [Chitinophagaceae bacterium]|nr:hypothetical protein [Rubrivivax sp.]